MTLRPFPLSATALLLALAACAPAAPADRATAEPTAGAEASAEAPAEAPTADAGAASPAAGPLGGADPRNATYLIDGRPIALVDGKAEGEAAPGSAERVTTQYFGNEVSLDLNGDGLLDTALLLTHATGGTGTFYLAAAALRNADGSYSGSDTVYLGDRIAPQSSGVDPANPAQFIVNYADRRPDEPMIAQPSVGVSRTFGWVDGHLVEAGG